MNKISSVQCASYNHEKKTIKMFHINIGKFLLICVSKSKFTVNYNIPLILFINGTF